MKLNYVFVLVLITIMIIVVAVMSGTGNWDTPPPSRQAPVITAPPVTESPVVRAPSRVVSRGEKECRRVLERIYGVTFSTIRPDWLKSTETNSNLELDCYAKVPLSMIDAEYTRDDIMIEIACEYNGKQHYERVEKFQRTEDKFVTQVWNDDYKRKLCSLYGVHLIEVPYSVPLTMIEVFIRDELTKRGLLPSKK